MYPIQRTYTFGILMMGIDVHLILLCDSEFLSINIYEIELSSGLLRKKYFILTVVKVAECIYLRIKISRQFSVK